jgi:predicted dithiol-disulfide oxidoreductase (DUF899 family)
VATGARGHDGEREDPQAQGATRSPPRGGAWSFYDLTPFGRQATWQDAPAGTPQGAPYEWWRRHGAYESRAGASRKA